MFVPVFRDALFVAPRNQINNNNNNNRCLLVEHVCVCPENPLWHFCFSKIAPQISYCPPRD